MKRHARDARREKLHAAIEQSLAELEAGQTVPFVEVIASLRAKRLARASVDAMIQPCDGMSER